MNLAFFRNTETGSTLPFAVDLAKIKPLRGRGRGRFNRGRGSGGVRGKGKGRGKSSTVTSGQASIEVSSVDPIPSNVKPVDSQSAETLQNVDQTQEQPTTSDTVNEGITDSNPVSLTQNIGEIHSNLSINVEAPIPQGTDEIQPNKPADVVDNVQDNELLSYLTQDNLTGSIEPVPDTNAGITDTVQVEPDTGEDIQEPKIDNVEPSIPIIGHVKFNTEQEYNRELQERFDSKFLVMCVRKYVNLLKC